MDFIEWLKSDQDLTGLNYAVSFEFYFQNAIKMYLKLLLHFRLQVPEYVVGT